MKKSVFLLNLFALLINLHVVAQSLSTYAPFTVKEGEIAKVPNFRMRAFIGADSSGIYVRGDRMDQRELVKFSPDLKHELTVPLELQGGGYIIASKYLLKNGRLLVFYEEQVQKSGVKTYTMYMQELDTRTLIPKALPLLLCTNMTDKPMMNRESEIELFFPECVDEFIVAYQDTLDEDKRRINLEVFDYSGIKLRSIETPNEINYSNYMIDIDCATNGRLFVNYGFDNLYVFNQDGKLEKKIELGLNETNIIQKDGLLFDNQNNVYLTYLTFYPDTKRITGIMYVKVNGNGDVVKTVHPFSQEYVLKNQNWQAKSNAEAEFRKHG